MSLKSVLDYKKLEFPKWLIFKDTVGDFRFRLIAMNSKIIFVV